MKRSWQPPFWLAFGAGGMLAALVGWAVVLVTGIAGPLGVVDWMAPARMHAFAASWPGKAALFAFIALLLWHGAHRIFHTLHDFGIRTGPVAMAACYGVALAGTLVAAAALAAI